MTHAVVQSLSCPTLCDPHGLQHTRLPCPSSSPKACPNSCPLSQWCLDIGKISLIWKPALYDLWEEMLCITFRMEHWTVSSHPHILSLSLHSSCQGLRLCFLYPGPLGPRVRSWWQSSQLTLDEYVAWMRNIPLLLEATLFPSGDYHSITWLIKIDTWRR